jgi:hypothetical protein
MMSRADVGGFDAGSQFSWNVIGAYDFNIRVMNGITYTGMLGYRALSVDYEQGSRRTKYERATWAGHGRFRRRDPGAAHENCPVARSPLASSCTFPAAAP